MDDPGALRRGDFPVLHEHRVRWADVDVYGHVNNVVHYSLFDTAVNTWLQEATGVDVRQEPAIGLVVETSCRYLAELHFPGMVTSGLRLARLGRTSVTYELALFAADQDAPAAVGRFVHVYVDQVSRRPVPPPLSVLTALGGLRTAP